MPGESRTEAVLDLRGVSKRFGSHAAVSDVSLAIEKGSFYGLLGPSGCGKTTTLRLIAGFEQPDTGEILLNGRDIAGLRPYQRPVSTVFQSYALFPHLTTRGNIEFGLRRKGVDRAIMDRKVHEALDLVHMGRKADAYPAQLSGGEKQRVALARALVVEPELLLLDEPLSALDPNLRRQVRVELKSLQRRVGTTFVFVTHDQEEALSLSDCIAVLNKGRLEQTGTPEDLYLRPESRFVAGFLGAVNWLNGAGVRPELLHISPDKPSSGVKAVPGVVESCTFLGNCMHVHSRLASGEMVTAEVPVRAGDYTPGDTVHVWWHPKDELGVLPEE
jgi:ABC-type Fe3+/spermidine/putrescine transport system ATPase subunit